VVWAAAPPARSDSSGTEPVSSMGMGGRGKAARGLRKVQRGSMALRAGAAHRLTGDGAGGLEGWGGMGWSGHGGCVRQRRVGEAQGLKGNRRRAYRKVTRIAKDVAC
jgi:hypothetical protein